MTDVQLLRCEGCGAPLPAPKGRSSLTCNYCGRELMVVAGATHVTAQATARPVTDALLGGRAGADVGSGRRWSIPEMETRDWKATERGLWPVAARASSSWGGGWSERALLGPPRVYPRHGDISGAWAPRTRDSEVEWIETDFHADAPPVEAIRVFETNLPGASFAVTILDAGAEELVWRREPISDGHEARVLEIELTPPRPVRRVRVYVNNSLGASWSEVDTVGLLAVTPLPMALRSSPRRTRSLARGAWLLSGVAVVAVIMAVIAAASDGSHADATPTPPAASVRVAGTSLMVWDVSATDLTQRGIVWASEVAAFSSQYGETVNGAQRVIGPPDAWPTYRDHPAAWAPHGQGDGIEFIDVRFGDAVPASAVVVVESYGVGALARIEDLTPGRPSAVLWEGATSQAHSAARVVTVELGETREISAVRVVLDTRRRTGWNEIDAIGLYPAR